mmetsp:Transcript_24325/g.57252  ORF Transcript_24325/g.57252 Transcript_24325/m.57252 type:complete len:259 (-) Transcript_24325:31-807(-)
MCGPTSTSPSAFRGGGGKTSVAGGKTSVLDRFFPLHPAVAIAAFAILIPSGAYMNRGFTIWFYWASIFQALTQIAWLSDVLALVGTSICMGWYSSIFYEVFYYKLWFECLYKNMPMVLVQHMVREPPHGPCHWDTTASLVAMALSHFFDLLGHVVLTRYHYRKRRGGKATGKPFGWSAILAGYMYSRIWSAVHQYYNFGSIAWYYLGFEVYVINSVDMWYPAYIAETIWYGSVVIWKLTRKNKTDANAVLSKTTKIED